MWTRWASAWSGVWSGAVLLQIGEPAQFFDWLTKYGAPGVLAFLVVAFMFGWIVPGYVVKQKDADITALRLAVDELQKELRSQIVANQQSMGMKEAILTMVRQTMAAERAGGGGT